MTTIQISEKNLELLKKVKEETKSSSYDKAIRGIILLWIKESLAKESLAGHLSKYKIKDPYKGVRDKSHRF